MNTKIVVDCATGIQSTVELTEEEIAQINLNREENLAAREAEEAAEAQRAADRESGNAKLKELGLTDDEISALVD
jgi:hypothetical protein